MINREDRRNLIKQGASKETVDRMSLLSRPCTYRDALEISRASAEDVCRGLLHDYSKDMLGSFASIVLQLEILKEVVLKAGLITEEEFETKYALAADKFEEEQRDFHKQLKNQQVSAEDVPEGDAKFSMTNVSDIEVTKEM